ncbi:MAG TPA: efflux RND transporter periplasmic adaptor subunit, partial [Patescibacteria group bacterium]|nr:efflux RND transporter periplasmic adaptor subunit [Patescibacteria group bacterium]
MDNKTPARSNQANNATRSYTRQLIVGTVVVVSVSALIAGGRWLTYRMDHVVVSDAEVKGTITKIGARLDGQVKAILVNPGERVTKGQVLVKLEDQHLQAAAELAEAEFEAATNELSTELMAIKQERVRIPVEVEKATSILQSSSAVLEGDQSEAKRLSNEFQRVETLFKEGMASASDLDAITGARGKALADVKSVTSLQDAAQAGLEATKLELDTLRIREAHLGALQARVAIARAKIAAAQADLEAAILRAPEDGWVVERIVELGGSAKVGEPMISLWIGHPWVEAWASEKALSRLQLGSKARISLDAFPGRALRAHVESFGLLT